MDLDRLNTKIFHVGLVIISLAVIAVELALTRAFDVILARGASYLVVTFVMFALGFGGMYVALRPVHSSKSEIRDYFSFLSLLLGVAIFSILPLVNILPFDFEKLFKDFFIQMVYFSILCIVLFLPFFITGVILSAMFSGVKGKISSLYFCDLLGVALGSIIATGLLPVFGPGGILFCACGLAFIASAVFSRRRFWAIAKVLVGMFILLLPVFRLPHYYDFHEHANKHNVKRYGESGKKEYIGWDIVAKVDVIRNSAFSKLIAYDGGDTISSFYAFDGDFEKLRKNLFKNFTIKRQFSLRDILASHYFKKDTNQEVLIFGFGGGREIKAALMYGAAKVTGVEVVKTIVELGKNRYSDFIGGIFRHPKVQIYTDEARSWLRRNQKKYDIIQLYSVSIHPTGIIPGICFMRPSYLYTREAYLEYFKCLKPKGILQINGRYYPTVITMAALAWRASGRGNFQKHVLVFQGQDKKLSATVLIKMDPWEEGEVNRLTDFFSQNLSENEPLNTVIENPIYPEKSFLSCDFYTGYPSKQSVRKLPYPITPLTDDRPYFIFLQPLKNISTSKHSLAFAVSVIFGIFFTAIFAALSMYIVKNKKLEVPKLKSIAVYFSLIGAGFIIIELASIQIFLGFIGYQLYSYSTVIFSLLLGGGLGSLFSRKMILMFKKPWRVSFVALLTAGCAYVFFYQYLFYGFLSYPLICRVILSVLLIFPLGFFSGIIFPMGIKLICEEKETLVALAYGFNSFFTVIGGLLCVIFSSFLGFKLTLLTALLFYCFAFSVFRKT